MNMFARFNENPAMTLQDIKETKRYGRTHARTNGQRETVYPLQTKFAGAIIKGLISNMWLFFCYTIQLITIKLCTKFQNPNSGSC